MEELDDGEGEALAVRHGGRSVGATPGQGTEDAPSSQD